MGWRLGERRNVYRNLAEKYIGKRPHEGAGIWCRITSQEKVLRMGS
jgi:hypothetical protein